MADTTEKPASATRPRTMARVAAVQALFQIEQGGDDSETVIVQFMNHRFGTGHEGAVFDDGEVPQADIALFVELIRTVAANRSRLDALLAATLPATWPANRLDPVLRALFRAAIAELDAPKAPPSSVVINEYLDIAHGFFSGDEAGLVNGALDAIARKIASGETEIPATDAAEDDDASEPEAHSTDADHA